MKTEEPVGK